MEFAVFGVLSLIITILSVVWVLKFHKKSAVGKRMSALSAFTIGIAAAVFVLLLPLYYVEFDFGGVRLFGPILLTLLNTLQVFINEGSTDTFENLLNCAIEYIPGVRVPYMLYAALLIVAAPILTFGNVLSMFKGFTEEMRFAFSKHKRVYIMSEMNNCSVTLAKSIVNNSETHGKRLIVFTNFDDDDTDIELISAAKEMNAVILKRNITDRDIVRFKKPAEVYFIGSDKNENISQAAAMTEALNSRAAENKHIAEREIKIFAFAHSRAGGCVIDSTEYGNLLNGERLNSNIANGTYTAPKFRLRRVDVVRQFVWNEIQNMGFFSDTFSANTDISILIVGFGTYGIEFFKTASWFCQLKGRKVEINIIDKEPDVRSILKRHCPELMNITAINPDYSVQCFSGIDLNTSAFDELLNGQNGGESPETAARLSRTTHALITLGDDETNTNAAIYLRELFDRVNPPEFDDKKQPLFENTQIYAILYDEYLNGEDLPQSRTLINHNKTRYDIHFIGGLAAKYSHEIVYDEQLEAGAFKEHVSWLFKDISKLPPEQQQARFNDEILKYEKFEYYRLSSMSKALYFEKALKPLISSMTGSERDKLLEDNEHDRWVQYMCSQGHIYSKQRNDRAKTHNAIVHFDNVPDREKRKDGYADNKFDGGK